MVVYIIGPSRSGKTTLTTKIISQYLDIRGCSLTRIDLDEKRGPSHRGRAAKAILLSEQLEKSHQVTSLLIVDVGQEVYRCEDQT